MQRVISFGGRVMRVAVTGGLAALALACGSVTDSLLEAEDPDLISPENARSADVCNSKSTCFCRSNGVITSTRAVAASVTLTAVRSAWNRYIATLPASVDPMTMRNVS